MVSLKSRLLAVICLLSLGAILVATMPAAGAIQPEDAAVDAAAEASVERGRYIANDLAMCVQCHSPRDRRGELIGDRLFDGAPLPVKSPFSGSPRWAFTAPNLRNAPGYTESEFIDFLMSGKRPNGTEARGPMPPYRMNSDDAKAVYDYLMSF